MKTLKLILAAVIAYCFIHFVFPLLFLVGGFALAESEEIIKSAESPNGEYVAELYRFSPGFGPSPYEYYLTVREKGEKPDMRKKQIADSRKEFEFAWTGPEELLVTARTAKQLGGKETYKKVQIRYAANIPAWGRSLREVYPVAEDVAYGLGGREIGLADFVMTFRGQEAIRGRKGETRYEFHGWDIHRSALLYSVTIDGRKNAVVGVERKPRHEQYRKRDIWAWPDTGDFFRVLEEQAGLGKIVSGYENPVMIIKSDAERCEIVIGEASTPVEGRQTRIFIDSATGKIVPGMAK
ncbi:hypothetical protein [Anaeroselena agilis]|uniref:DUF3108 domain-containing protein n=1 Tax=Anaeroselena agilis TaxID=3063788 RepID=A0ABU3NYB7_9FIRM|nr:hypothetical protein [Selenomonadales bacterium 4137-cl]